MSFFWYIDISEGADAAGDEIVDPENIPEGSPALVHGQYNVGPIQFSDDEELTVYDLLERIQASLDSAFAAGTLPRPYYIDARVRPIQISDMATQTGTSLVEGAGITTIGDARESGELAIEYRLYNEENKAFSLLFRSGVNGYAANEGQMPGGGLPPVARITAINNSSVKGVPSPYCEGLSAMVSDKPPMPPDLVFVPYVGVNNKLLLLFNSMAGEKTESPITLEPGDVSFLLGEYFAQHGLTVTPDDLTSVSKNKKLQYRSDDPVRKYQLFRIKEFPKGYQSFQNKAHGGEIQAQLGPDKFSTAAALVDTIAPNQKYYYCARAIDVHNNISNPTYIYEVEMVDNRGQMYLKTRPIVFDPAKYRYTRRGERYMAIRPADSQTAYSSTANPPTTLGINDAPDANLLGTAADKVWDKTFKIRVTSKRTGRKIDLNLTFKNTGVVIP